MQAHTGLSGLSALVTGGGGGGGPTTQLLDHFTDTNGTAIASHTMDTGAGWTLNSGSGVTIQSNKASWNGTQAYITADAGQADVTQTALVKNLTANSQRGLIGRFTDTSNLWVVGFNDQTTTNNWTITEIASGTSTNRATGSVTLTQGVEQTVAVTYSGSTITATVNGGNQISYGSATSNQTATRFGVRLATNLSTADDFQVTHP